MVYFLDFLLLQKTNVDVGFINRHDNLDTLLEGLDISQDPLLDTLQRGFYYNDFLEGKREIVERILERDDGVVLMPTGGGKTLTFTLPAVVSDGLIVIIFSNTLSYSGYV